MKHSLYEQFKQWLDIEKLGRNTVKPARYNMNQNHLKDLLVETQSELSKLRRENAMLRKENQARQQWLTDAKERAGYDINVSFDEVFNDLLESKEKSNG